MNATLTTTLFLSLLSAVFSQSADTNTYSNPTLGVTVTKPKDWLFATAEQHAENLSRTKLKDEEFQKLVQKYSTAPLIVMMKYPEPFDDLNPSLKINIKPLGTLAADDPKAILSLMTASLGNKFEDFKVVLPARETTLGGRKAAYVKFHYSLQIPDGRSFPTCSELWVVPRGKHFFIIGSGTRQDEKTGKREEIEKILASLKLE
jgi:hypothetical protein